MLKGAIIGFGKIAETAHLPAFLSEDIGREIQITSIVDVSDSRIEQCKSLIPEVKGYHTLDELFNNEQLDFIDICVPPNMHDAAINIALENDVHIICEKPFTINVDKAKNLYHKIIASGKFFMPCHQYKFAPVWQKFVDVIKQMDIKYKPFVQFNVFRLHADDGFDPLNPGWRSDSSVSGGGILTDTGYHYLYLILNMLGLPKSISSFTDKLYHLDYNSEDTALVIVECENGIAQLNLSWAGNARENNASIVSPACSVFYNGSKVDIVKNDMRSSFEVPNMSDKVNYINLYKTLFYEFASKVHKGQSCIENLNEAYLSMLMLDKCYHNSHSGSMISFEGIS